MKRKIILLSAIAVLAIIYILQLTFTGKSKVKTLSLTEDIDSIVIEQGASSNVLTLSLEGKDWHIGKYKADESTASAMVDALKSIKVLGTITANVNNDEQRYGLEINNKIVVKAQKNGQVLRTITIGKNTSTGSQCYAQVDGKNVVCLVNGSLHTTFTCTQESLRAKGIYSLSAEGITSISVSSQNGSNNFSIQKEENEQKADSSEDGSESITVPQANWIFVGEVEGKGDVNIKNVQTWTSSLANLSASEWCSEGTPVPQEAEMTVSFVCNGTNYSISFYPKDDEENQRLCTCNVAQTPFYLSEYIAQRLMQDLSSILSE